MKFPRVLTVLLFSSLLVMNVSAGEEITPSDAAQRVAAGEAVLIDVREPNEWKDGVAAPALLLSLSDLRGKRRDWQSALERHRDKELILYCRSGNRSSIAGQILEKEDFRTRNAGGFAAWRDAGLPVRSPAATPAP
ncbi:MAG TPA: rhodanese-like domain-containing protein [Candidatus Synoicihabitans sp.]|nr:rhodanese-like domain-containing protein [Candidatus Synoicihabitans sp.]